MHNTHHSHWTINTNPLSLSHYYHLHCWPNPCVVIHISDRETVKGPWPGIVWRPLSDFITAAPYLKYVSRSQFYSAMRPRLWLSNLPDDCYWSCCWAWPVKHRQGKSYQLLQAHIPLTWCWRSTWCWGRQVDHLISLMKWAWDLRQFIHEEGHAIPCLGTPNHNGSTLQSHSVLLVLVNVHARVVLVIRPHQMFDWHVSSSCSSSCYTEIYYHYVHSVQHTICVQGR